MGEVCTRGAREEEKPVPYSRPWIGLKGAVPRGMGSTVSAILDDVRDTMDQLVKEIVHTSQGTMNEVSVLEGAVDSTATATICSPSGRDVGI